MLKKIDIKMGALNRPVREFRDLLERKKEQEEIKRKKEKRPGLFDVELEMGQVKPNQYLALDERKQDELEDLFKMVRHNFWMLMNA